MLEEAKVHVDIVITLMVIYILQTVANCGINFKFSLCYDYFELMLH
jgi:hypothetical protein